MSLELKFENKPKHINLERSDLKLMFKVFDTWTEKISFIW